jgi:hypothetical protein
MRAYPEDETPMSFLGGGSTLSSPNWPVHAETLTNPEMSREQLRNVMQLLLTQSVPQTLRQAKLIN